MYLSILTLFLTLKKLSVLRIQKPHFTDIMINREKYTQYIISRVKSSDQSKANHKI
jgi:hypothetical protein